MDLKQLLQQKEMVIVAGSGGVGKTTLSAAIAIQGTKMGRRCIVLTIDPAKRLANALGFKAFGHAPKKIAIGDKTLTAMMLDTKHTFDELIKQYAPSEEVREKILKNRIYHYLSSMLAGTQEYMALEKLYELNASGKYDLVVLDTPPTKHALSFLEAPDRLARFLDEKTLRWFLKPYFMAGKLSIKLVSTGSYFVFKFIERFTGLELLYDLSEFFLNLQTLYGGFRERTLKAKKILYSEKSSFLLITNPEKILLEQATEFYEHIQKNHLPLGGVIINRIAKAAPLSAREEKELETLPPKSLSLFKSYLSLAHREKEEIDRFKKGVKSKLPIYEIPSFERDVYDIKDLNLINLHLFQ